MAEHPEHGARIELLRLAVEDDAAFYRVAILGPRQARWEADVTLPRPSGGVTYGPFSPEEPPAWTRRYCDALLRGLVKKHGAADDGAFPRKVTRWRAEER